MTQYGRTARKRSVSKTGIPVAVSKKEFRELRALLLAASAILAVFSLLNLLAVRVLAHTPAARTLAVLMLSKGALPILFLCAAVALWAFNAGWEAGLPTDEALLQTGEDLPDPVAVKRRTLLGMRFFLFAVSAFLAASAWFMISTAANTPYLGVLSPAAHFLLNRTPWLLLFLCFYSCYQAVTVTVKK